MSRPVRTSTRIASGRLLGVYEHAARESLGIRIKVTGHKLRSGQRLERVAERRVAARNVRIAYDTHERKPRLCHAVGVLGAAR